MTRRNLLKGARLNLCHAVLAIAVASSLSPNYANAQALEARSDFNIPSGDLVAAVDAYSKQSGVQIMYKPELLTGKRAGAVKGSLTNREVIALLLKGTGIKWERVDDRTMVLRQAQHPAQGKKDSGPAQSPPLSEGGDGVQELERMVVVGSRLGTSPLESAMPIKVITREEIDRSGAGSIAQVLSYLSEIPVNNLGDSEIGYGTGLYEGNTNSTTVQMRGLERGTTLILINGRRAGDSASFASSGQFDLSTIPLGLVERIEVLPAGASSVYGGDGLAGVINVVLRRDASGFELRLRKLSADNYGQDQASMMWGSSWAKGNMTLAANWSKSRALFGDKRELTADQDYSRYGGDDLRSTNSNPANVYSLAGCTRIPGSCRVPLSQRGPLPGLGSSFATVPAGQDGVGLTPADFSQTQGQLNRTSIIRNLRSAEENYGVALSGNLRFGETIETFAELSYTKRDVPAYQVPFTLYGGSTGTYGAVVSADNPYNPFGVPVGVDYRLQETGLYTEYKQESYRGVVGASGKLGRFTWEFSQAQTRDLSGASGPATLNLDGIQAALSSSDPAMALNPFVGNGAAPASTELLRSLYGELPQDNESRTDVLTGYIRGPVLHAPAGDIIGLIGLERQRNGYFTDSEDLEGNLVPYINGVTRSHAYFAEMRIPVLAPRAGSSVERLALSGAIRSESSDRTEDRTQSETVGLEFRPTESLLLRATYSTAFRPLLNYNAVQSPYESIALIRDPKDDPTRLIRVNAILFGGVPEELNAETSTTTTFGFRYRPSENMTFSLTAWDIKFRDRITTLAVQTIVDNEDAFAGRVRRNQTTGLIESVDARPVNIAMDDTSGVDIGADVRWFTRAGEFNTGFTATYTSKYEQQVSDESPVTTHVSKYSSTGWAPRWKIVPRVEWVASEWLSAFMTGRYVSRYTDSTPLSSGPNEGQYKSLGNFWIVDFNANISLARFVAKGSFLENSRLSIGSTNLLNRLPEFCAGCYGLGYDASQYDIVGRSAYAELRLSF